MRAIPGNRIVATLGPYKYYVAIPLIHLWIATIPGSCTVATLGLYTWQGANYT